VGGRVVDTPSLTAFSPLLFSYCCHQIAAGRSLTNADVINEDSRSARVRVEGVVNGTPFVVERTVVRRGRGAALTFVLGAEERTAQDMRLTQVGLRAEHVCRRAWVGTGRPGREVWGWDVCQRRKGQGG
jgi:hypothetical protein